jgi:hypothetical protein
MYRTIQKLCGAFSISVKETQKNKSQEAAIPKQEAFVTAKQNCRNAINLHLHQTG